MATTRLYYEDVFRDRSPAVFLRAADLDGRPAAVLDSTVFYPEGGGQPSDRGSIGGVPVLDVREHDGEVYHVLSEPPAFRPGQEVELRLDAARRIDLATQHTAQHLLSATVLRLTGAPTVSMHLGDDACTVDVDSPDLSAADLSACEEAAFDVVEADYPVVVHLCPPEDPASFPLRKKLPEGQEVVRVVEIDGYDFSPCCGTHLPSTRHIGSIKVLGFERYKGMTRVAFAAGRRAFRDHRACRAAAEKAGAAFRVPPAAGGDAAAAAAERIAALNRTVLGLRESLAAFEAERLVARSGAPVLETFRDRSMDEALRIARAAQKLTRSPVVVASAVERKAAVLCSAPDADLRPAFRSLAEACRAKGGGGPSFVQASFDAGADLEAFMAAAAETFKGDGR